MFPENVLYEKENASDLSTPGLVNVCVYVCGGVLIVFN